MRYRKKCSLMVLLLVLGVSLCSCKKEDARQREIYMGESRTVIPAEAKTVKETAEQWAMGYDLPIDGKEKEEAENDCIQMMELVQEIYRQADKGESINTVLSNETILLMQDEIKESGNPVTAAIVYCDMGNYKIVDQFLTDCREGKNGTAVVYEVHQDGGIGRRKFIFDGTDLYVLGTRAVWDKESKPGVAYVSYSRVKKWEYTKKGWFCYELYVPQPPEVSEIVDGSSLVRVKPMTKKQREMSERCVKGLGYQGNNILCSNWDTAHMEHLDYNGMYEYLYAMKYHEKFNPEPYPDGIPEKEFEDLIMDYLPVTAEQIREYAVYHERTRTYAWERLGCLNYAPNYFGTCLPEVTDIKENRDGTITLTVEAVCDTFLCNDAVITHELTVRFLEDGSFQYLGNKILNDGISDIPDYQYRIRKE